ncbi:MAG: bifunctional hydroxymethylpyrimidine kinase/phosphomethylpyrimidine kinase [Leptospirales bacterium]|nr:bifunctional hydroxymethylpyrimidine kinase/phosphomethylpyrimidine kinase [Leptospirales bacterium]
MKPHELPVTLTIAGSDSGGGAGIQADLKTFQAFGCFGTSAITALTCQNTRGVSAVQAAHPGIVAGQLRDVLHDFPVRAAKTGMLFSADIIRTVAEVWQSEARNIPLIVDPVMVAASGARLLEQEAEQELSRYLSLATLITPNLPEASVLLAREVATLSEMREAARELHNRTRAAILLKGGHREGDRERPGEAIDVFFDGEVEELLSRPMLRTENTHGTGCTLSAGIAAGLAQGRSLLDAIAAARDYLQGAIEHAPRLGAGAGPLNHLWQMART